MNISTTTYKTIKQRLDLLLVEQGFFPTREKARSAIMAGLVRVGSQIYDKPGLKLGELPEQLEVKTLCPYVSRGGLKLEKALQVFDVSPQDRVCLDMGASTGGFTDCLLQNGAQKVYAVDVGYGQFDYQLRQDKRVVCLERTNGRHLTPETLYKGAEPASLAVMDVSFISILKIMPALYQLLAPDGLLVSLIKPQFEAPADMNQKGIVRDPKAHLWVLDTIQTQSPEHGFFLHQVISSPIKGNKGGNREFLGVFYKYAAATPCELESCLNEKDV